MGTIIQTELQKLKRRKLVWGILVLTTLIALFAFERESIVIAEAVHERALSGNAARAFKSKKSN